MNRPLKAVLLGAALSSLAAVYAVAQEERSARPEEPDARPRAAVRGEAAPNAIAPEPEVAADAPNARLAALIRRDLVIQRNKNVGNVRRIATGIYCIRPRPASGINPATAIVVVSPEFFFSLFNEITVQWATRGSGCAANEIGVYTFADANLDARYTFSNAVSFSIIVP